MSQNVRRYEYGNINKRASDIILSDQQLCEAMGYLAREGRMRIEAQVHMERKKF